MTNMQNFCPRGLPLQSQEGIKHTIRYRRAELRKSEFYFSSCATFLLLNRVLGVLERQENTKRYDSVVACKTFAYLSSPWRTLQLCSRHQPSISNLKFCPIQTSDPSEMRKGCLLAAENWTISSYFRYQHFDNSTSFLHWFVDYLSCSQNHRKTDGHKFFLA
jgi:hypothetical protein